MQKGFAPILILVGVLIIALVSGGAYFFSKAQVSKPQSSNPPVISQTPQPISIPSSTPDETGNWKTYTNNKYGYSIKYPPQWQINPPAVGDEILIGGGEPNEDQINISVIQTAPSLSVQDNCREIKLDTIQATRCESTQKVSGERGVKYNPPITSRTVLVIGHYKNSYYVISLTYNESSEKFKLLDQMLTTFKFLDQKQVTESPAEIAEKDNGKTFSYTNTSRFSITLDKNKYPVKNLKCSPTGIIGEITNLSLYGPDNYPTGYEAVASGTCILKNGDFSVTIKVQ